MMLSLVAVALPLAGIANATHGACDLNISPENDTNPTGQTHTLTATLVEAGASPETAAVCNDVRNGSTNIDFEIDCVSGATAAYTGETGGNAEDSGAACAADAAGAGDDLRTTPDMTCTIGPNAGGASDAPTNSCTVSYTRSTDGQDEIVGWVDEDVNDTTDNSDAGETQPQNDEDDTDAVVKFWSDPTQQQINCGPETDINPTGTQHTVTCTVRSAAGANPVLEGADVDYQVTGANPTGPQHGCNTAANGTCSFTYTGTNAGGDVIQAFVNQDASHTNNDCGAEATGDAENDDFCDQVEKTWQTRTATFLDVEPETDTNANQTTHTLTATFTDQFGDPIELSEGQLVDFEIISGPNTNITPGFRDFECPSNNPTVGGSCTASYTDAAGFDSNNATDTICGWLSTDGDDDQFDPNGSAADGGDCDVETPNETEQGVDPNGNTIPGNEGNDSTDVVLKTWTAPAAPTATRVNCFPDLDGNPTGNNHIVTCHVTGAGGADVPGANVDVEATGANDPDGANTPGSPDWDCGPTDANGECTFTHGPGGNSNGTNTSATSGQTTYRAWLQGTTADAGEGQCDRANEDGEGCTNVQPGAAEGPNGDLTDVMVKNWFGPANTITISPTTDSAAAGTCNEFTVTVLDAQGNPVQGAEADVRQTHDSHGNANTTDDATIGFCDPGGTGPGEPGNTAAGTDLDDDADCGVTGTADNSRCTGETIATTNASGQLTFGITVTNNANAPGTVTVEAWIDNNGDDLPTAGEPETNPDATKTWTPGGGDAITTLNAEPENDENPNGGQHLITVTMTNAAGNPISGATPNARVNTGPNANATYACTASNASGVSFCTFNDPAGTPPGTDAITVWVNQTGGGTPGPDASEPQDDVQKEWTTVPSGLGIDLSCEGVGVGDDHDQDPNIDQGYERTGDGGAERTDDCNNPVSDTDATFTAFAFDPGTNASKADDTPEEGVVVRFDITAESVGDIDFQPVSPFGANGPAYCSTGADGTCSVTVRNPTPVANDNVDVQATIDQQTNTGTFGNNNDTATKFWRQQGVATRLVLDPRADTNALGTAHTVTGTITDFQGNPVAGELVTFNVTGRNNGALGSGPDTSDAAGQVTFTYTDSGPQPPVSSGGTDTITADTAAVAGSPDDTVSKDWRAGGMPTADDVQIDNGGDCDVDDGTIDAGRPDEPNGSGDTRFEEDLYDGAGAPDGGAGNVITNNVETIHVVCAVAYSNTNPNGTNDANGDPISGKSITFTLSGPGNFTDVTGTQNLGQSITVPMNEFDVARVRVTSTQAGATTITATADGQSDDGVKNWMAVPPRNIDCEPESGENEPGTDHVITCVVTDRDGNPVAGVAVNFRIGAGDPGRFSNIGCAGTQTNCVIRTDALGRAQVVLSTTTTESGTTEVTAEINSAGGGAAVGGAHSDVGDIDGPADQDDECDRIVNDPAGAPAGNCEDVVEKDWVEGAGDAECEDGVDNDGDGLIDFPDDPGCDNADDDDESDVDGPGGGPCQNFEFGSRQPNPGGSGEIIVGTNGADVLAGTAGDDIICGLDGNDIITGGGGDDRIVGNAGNDSIEGNGGKDTINGNRGNDTIDGNRKNDVIRGSKGDDTIRGNRGHDTLRGGGGKDTLQGGKGDDILRGGGGNDTLKGFTGDDILNGGSGTDTCKPGKGNDRVSNCER